MPAVIGSPDDAADAWRPHHIKLIYYRDDEEEAVWGNDGETATFDLCACACRVHHVGSWRVARWRVSKRCAHAAFRFPMTKAGVSGNRPKEGNGAALLSTFDLSMSILFVALLLLSPPYVYMVERMSSFSYSSHRRRIPHRVIYNWKTKRKSSKNRQANWKWEPSIAAAAAANILSRFNTIVFLLLQILYNIIIIIRRIRKTKTNCTVRLLFVPRGLSGSLKCV